MRLNGLSGLASTQMARVIGLLLSQNCLEVGSGQPTELQKAENANMLDHSMMLDAHIWSRAHDNPNRNLPGSRLLQLLAFDLH
jgi:hypothetical protein